MSPLLTTSPVVTGTSLAVLQAYPLGTLKVRTPDGEGTVIGFHYNRVSERYCPVVDLDISRDKIGMGYSVVDCLPYLRPFSALCDLLPDGTVPLLQIMKLALPVGESFGPIRTTESNEFYVHAYIGSQFVKCWITDEWNVQLYGWGSYEPFVKNQAAIVDYLRSQRFAVGLEPHQFIAKA